MRMDINVLIIIIILGKKQTQLLLIKNLHKFCRDLNKDVPGLKSDITNNTGSYIAFHHSRCVVISNLRTVENDPRRAVQHNDMKMVGIEVARPLIPAELPSPDNCRSVFC